MLCYAVLSYQSCPTLCDPMDCSPPGYSVHGDSPGKNTGVLPCPSPGIFPTQGLNPSLPHCRQILYHLSHQGSPASQEWVACPFFRGTSWPRNWTGVSCIASGLFNNWTIRKPLEENKAYLKWFYQWIHSVLLYSALSVRVNCASHLYHTGLSF